jgi:flavin-dependent dehydrogenase
VRAKATLVSRHGSGWRVTTASGEYDADFLIAADGAMSRVRRQLIGPIPRENLVRCINDYLDPVAADTAVFALGDFEGYLWYFPRKKSASLGIGDRSTGLSIDKLHKRLVEYRRAHYPGARLQRRAGGIVPSIRNAKFYERPFAAERWALIGDAAALVDPITAEGIRYALESGALAARHAIAGNLAQFEQEWRDRHDAEFLRKIRAVYLRENLIDAGVNVRNQIFSNTLGMPVHSAPAHRAQHSPPSAPSSPARRALPPQQGT